ncbi:MAG TPA: cobalt transporter, partial [Helicobacter sp.]|nr:cobalt transporter [Helicobacter sp.]
MKYITALMLYISVMCANDFIDFNKLEEEFYVYMPTNKYVMSLDEFMTRVEKNSINLAKSRAMAQALTYEGKAMRAWNSSYLEVETNHVKS